MPVPSKITDLSINEGSNSPLGTENVGSPGSVDDYLRAIQAILRSESLLKSWQVQGDVVTYISPTSFSVTGDRVAAYSVHRRLQANGASIIYGAISASSFNGTITTVTIVPDSGGLDPALISVYLGIDPRSSDSITSTDVIAALGYTPVNKAGDTMGGQLLQPLAPDTPSALVNKNYVDNLIATSVTPGVTSFNTRTGAVALASDDVITALGYRPANVAGDFFTGNIGITGTGTFSQGVSANFFQPKYYTANVGGSVTIDAANGQVQNLTLTSNLVINGIINVPLGSTIKVILAPTTFLVTFPGDVHWPMGLAPSIADGPLKAVIVTMQNLGAYLATATMY